MRTQTLLHAVAGRIGIGDYMMSHMTLGAVQLLLSVLAMTCFLAPGAILIYGRIRREMEYLRQEDTISGKPAEPGRNDIDHAENLDELISISRRKSPKGRMGKFLARKGISNAICLQAMLLCSGICFALGSYKLDNIRSQAVSYGIESPEQMPMRSLLALISDKMKGAD